MKTYQYSARNIKGALHKGTIEADSESEVYQKLKEQGLYCVSMELRREKARESRKKMRLQDVSLFCRQLSIMLSSGLMVARALNILYDRETNKTVKSSYLRMCEDVQKGLSLCEAMKEQGVFYPKLLVSMVQAGERSGTLDDVMQKMSDHYEREYRLISRLRASMAYPIFLVGMALVVMVGLFVFVLPNFFSMFEGTKLPLITQAVMAISGFLTYQWPFLLVGVMVLAAVWTVIRDIPKVRLAVDRMKLRLPLFGKQIRTIYVARLTHALSILYSSGIPMIDAVELAVGVLDNTYITGKFRQVVTDIGQGDMLSVSIAKTELFDQMVTSMIYVGEESGSLDQMLSKISGFYDSEAEMAMQKLTSLLEPVMLVIIALMVGVIMAAVMLPIYDMYSSVL